METPEALHDLDMKIQAIERELMIHAHQCETNHQLLQQKLDFNNIALHDMITNATKSLSDLAAQIQQAHSFNDRVTQTWKVIATVSIVISALLGAAYTVHKDVEQQNTPTTYQSSHK
jgi:hypothetical protein